MKIHLGDRTMSRPKCNRGFTGECLITSDITMVDCHICRTELQPRNALLKGCVRISRTKNVAGGIVFSTKRLSYNKVEDEV